MPGPGHYCIAAADGVVNGPTAPAWTIAARAHDATAAAAAAKSAWPGPATYDVTFGAPQGPAYSMQGKAKATDGGECCRCIMALFTVLQGCSKGSGRARNARQQVPLMTGLQSSKAYHTAFVTSNAGRVLLVLCPTCNVLSIALKADCASSLQLRCACSPAYRSRRLHPRTCGLLPRSQHPAALRPLLYHCRAWTS